MSKVFRFISSSWQEIPSHPYSGSVWAYEIAKEVSKYPELVEPRLYAQAHAYARMGGTYEGLGYSSQQAAEYLYKSGKKLSGWSREVIFESLHRFEPGPEEARLLEPFEQATKFGGREWVKRWNKAALLNKYTKAVEHSQSIESLAIQAVKANVGHEWAKRVVAKRPGLAPAIESAMKVAQNVAPARGFAPLLKETMASAWRNRFPLSVGLGITGLYVLQAGQWFSGKDDAWNSIEGMPHGGQAEEMRKMLTDFGSGWIGNLFRRVFKQNRLIKQKLQKEFYISASELPYLSHVQIGKRLGTTGPVTIAARVPAIQESFYISATELPYLSRGEINQRLRIISPIERIDNTLSEKVTYSGPMPKPNTIEGLSHGPISKKGNTDAGFGSPWRGLIKIPKILQGPARRAGMAAFSGTPEQALHMIGGQMKKEIPSLMQRGPRAIAAIEKQKTALNQLMGEMKRSPFQDTVLVNPLAMKQQAKALGVEPGLYLRGTLMHERFHQMITQNNMRDWIANAKMKVPRGFRKPLEKAYKQQGKTLDKATLKEEYLAYSLTEKYTGRLNPKLFNEADRIHEQIALELQQRKLAKTTRWHDYHQRSVRRASMNSLRPGKRHRQQAGRIVQ